MENVVEKIVLTAFCIQKSAGTAGTKIIPKCTCHNKNNSKKVGDKMLAIRLTSRRYIHLTRNLCCKFKFNEVQTEKILSVVNSSTVEDLTDRFGLSRTRANKLHFGLQQISKDVTTVDELIDIGGFSEKVFDRLCQKILNEEGVISNEDEEEEEDSPDGSNKKQKNLSFTNPKVPNSVLSQIKTFTSVQCGVTGLGWCTLELIPGGMTKIIHWDWRPLPEAKLTLHLMAAFVLNALKEVPQSDFYVFENPIATSVGSSQKTNLNVQISNMIGMASVLIGQRNALLGSESENNEKSIPNMTYLKKFSYARLFKLYVGTEQTSSSNYVETMLRWSNISSVTHDDVQTLIQVDDDLKSNYASSECHEKEFLSCTLLIGLAFLRLSILKCPDSHAILARKPKKKKV